MGGFPASPGARATAPERGTATGCAATSISRGSARRLGMRRGVDVDRCRQIPTFREAAATVIKLHRPNWRNAKSVTAWESTLKVYAYPKIGDMPVEAIEPADVMRCLLPIWNTKRETARKTRQRIGTVMKWGIAEGHRKDNPAGESIGLDADRHRNATTERGGADHHRSGSGTHFGTRCSRCVAREPNGDWAGVQGLKRLRRVRANAPRRCWRVWVCPDPLNPWMTQWSRRLARRLKRKRPFRGVGPATLSPAGYQE